MSWLSCMTREDQSQVHRAPSYRLARTPHSARLSAKPSSARTLPCAYPAGSRARTSHRVNQADRAKFDTRLKCSSFGTSSGIGAAARHALHVGFCCSRSSKRGLPASRKLKPRMAEMACDAPPLCYSTRIYLASGYLIPLSTAPTGECMDLVS